MKKNNRHFIAFIVTTMIYGVAIGFFLYSFDKNELSKKLKHNTQIASKVQIAIYQQKVKQEQPKKEKPKEVEKTIEQVIEKPIEKKIIKKDPPEEIEKKEIEKKEIEKKEIENFKEERIFKKEIEKEKVIEKSKEINKITEQNIVQKATITTKQQDTVQVDVNKLLEKQNKYFELVKQTVNQNKTYPKLALRRGIECDVKIKFTISRVGELLSLEIIDGHEAFHKAVTKTIQESFPIIPSKELFSSNTIMYLTLSYKINN